MCVVAAMDARVVVKCEGESVKSFPVPNTDAPEFNFKCIFYRKKPSQEKITIEVRLRLAIYVAGMFM